LLLVAAKPVGGHSAGNVLLAAKPHGCLRIPRDANKGRTVRLTGRPGGLPAMAAPESSLRLRQYWRYGRGTALETMTSVKTKQRHKVTLLVCREK